MKIEVNNKVDKVPKVKTGYLLENSLGHEDNSLIWNPH